LDGHVLCHSGRVFSRHFVHPSGHLLDHNRPPTGLETVSEAFSSLARTGSAQGKSKQPNQQACGTHSSEDGWPRSLKTSTLGERERGIGHPSHEPAVIARLGVDKSGLSQKYLSIYLSIYHWPSHASDEGGGERENIQARSSCSFSFLGICIGPGGERTRN